MISVGYFYRRQYHTGEEMVHVQKTTLFFTLFSSSLATSIICLTQLAPNSKIKNKTTSNAPLVVSDYNFYPCHDKKTNFTWNTFHWPTVIPHKNAGGYFAEALLDVLRLHKNLFDPDSFKIIASFFPAYITSRTFDCDIQNNFYCRTHHKNINQMCKSVHTVARFGLGIPMAILGSLAFLSPDTEMRLTSWIFLLGMPFVIFGKEILKKVKIDACKRPWNEFFSQKKQSYGGFPSGHVAEATYMAVLYGKRFGVKFGLPLGAGAIFIGTAFVNCNRHYVSQLIAGTGLGAMYALAADKLINSKLSEAMKLGLSLKQNGCPTMKLTYLF